MKRMYTLTPLLTNILVIRDEDDQKDGGIILPNQKKKNTGMVITCGNKVEALSENDNIMFHEFAGTNVIFEETNYLLMQEEDVVGIIKDSQIVDYKK